jgi:hypothetical protein
MYIFVLKFLTNQKKDIKIEFHNFDFTTFINQSENYIIFWLAEI